MSGWLATSSGGPLLDPPLVASLINDTTLVRHDEEDLVRIQRSLIGDQTLRAVTVTREKFVELVVLTPRLSLDNHQDYVYDLRKHHSEQRFTYVNSAWEVLGWQKHVNQ
jgi:hypothetical protein